MDHDTANINALLKPSPGDFWNERLFCPYFFVVDVKGDKITVLSCIGGPNSFTRKDEINARVDNKDGTWSFDYDKTMIVDRAWIEKLVRCEHINGFVADVRNDEKCKTILNEWRDHTSKKMKEKIDSLQKEWEEFTGWEYLKNGFSETA